MENKNSISIIPEHIQSKIYIIRGEKVMLDRDLAQLYGVKTMRLNEQVRRNIKRFPTDFMFQLNEDEFQNWISQIAISKKEKMGLRKKPLAFTEQGIAMLSGILHSDQAVTVNIQIMRVFTKLRKMLIDHEELRKRIEILEESYKSMGQNVYSVFKAFKEIKRMLNPRSSKTKIGFTINK